MRLLWLGALLLAVKQCHGRESGLLVDPSADRTDTAEAARNVPRRLAAGGGKVL